MNTIYHILNGDALAQQLPDSIRGEKTVARECLIDGDVSGATLDEFFENRAAFISSLDEEITAENYLIRTVPEFKKMLAIPAQSEVNLWFEDDLFCQVNFWFVMHLLTQQNVDRSYFLVRPEKLTQYGFRGYTSEALPGLFGQRIALPNPEEIARLWVIYQNGDIQELEEQALLLSDEFPFISQAVSAHLKRIPSGNKPGYPIQLLGEIMEDLGSEKFGPVFMEFNRRTPEYGYGDLQVKRMFDEISEN